MSAPVCYNEEEQLQQALLALHQVSKLITEIEFSVFFFKIYINQLTYEVISHYWGIDNN